MTTVDQSHQMPHKLRFLRVRFDGELAAHEVPAFRGAMAQKAGLEHSLFHNHTSEGYRYGYPLIRGQTRASRLHPLKEGLRPFKLTIRISKIRKSLEATSTKRRIACEAGQLLGRSGAHDVWGWASMRVGARDEPLPWASTPPGTNHGYTPSRQSPYRRPARRY
jgi:hypothetical protein